MTQHERPAPAALSGPDHYRRASELLAEYDHVRQVRDASLSAAKFPDAATRALEEQIRLHLSMAQLGARVIADLVSLEQRQGRRPDAAQRSLLDRWADAVHGRRNPHT